MKKTITIAMVIIMLLTMNVTTFANDYEVMPCFNNTITTSTHFTIDENGLATIGLRYVGYQNCATSATISCKIQKKGFFGWSDVSEASWVYECSSYMYNTSLTFQLTSTGTYQLVYEYVIRGTGGADDVITGTTQETYS